MWTPGVHTPGGTPDGTLIPIDRVAADRPFYSGKHKKHGMNVQVVIASDGTPL
ncbi:transposase family protein [Haloactinospora alba]|uniref:transposase family protein n=1 Tax=Haloactinospora alba TaxID=405555 RepID=UPI0011532785